MYVYVYGVILIMAHPCRSVSFFRTIFTGIYFDFDSGRWSSYDVSFIKVLNIKRYTYIYIANESEIVRVKEI